MLTAELSLVFIEKFLPHPASFSTLELQLTRHNGGIENNQGSQFCDFAHRVYPLTLVDWIHAVLLKSHNVLYC